MSSGFGRIMTEQLLARGDRIAGTVRDRIDVVVSNAGAGSSMAARPHVDHVTDDLVGFLQAIVAVR